MFLTHPIKCLFIAFEKKICVPPTTLILALGWSHAGSYAGPQPVLNQVHGVLAFHE